MLLAENRIELDARPVPAAASVLEVAMIGHLPSPPGEASAGARWDRVARDETLLDQITGLGLGEEAERLRRLLREGGGNSREDADLRALYHIPLPLGSLGQFQAIFPFAFASGPEFRTRYRTLLGGERPWLPQAVQDFFLSSSFSVPLRLWVIRVDERLGRAAFLPAAGADLLTPGALGAFERALMIPRCGVLLLPDLERLLVRYDIRDFPPLRVKQPTPVFLPCGEGAAAEEAPPPPAPPADEKEPPEWRPMMSRLAAAIARLRPDMQCLFSVPLATAAGSERPGPDAPFLGVFADSAPEFRHLQLLYPYLRGAEGTIYSAAGVVAGMQSAVSQRYGPWRSVAERPLPGRALPWPTPRHSEALALREAPGVTVLVNRAGRTVVDDERLCAPCLSAPELQRLTPSRRSDDDWYSAEVMRFMGWLKRELQALGERMIFEVDACDPRPELALRDFFTRLFGLGALRGLRAEDAFTLTDLSSGNTIVFEIEIAPVYPLDRLRITFLQERHLALSSGIEFGYG